MWFNWILQYFLIHRNLQWTVNACWIEAFLLTFAVLHWRTFNCCDARNWLLSNRMKNFPFVNEAWHIIRKKAYVRFHIWKICRMQRCSQSQNEAKLIELLFYVVYKRCIIPLRIQIICILETHFYIVMCVYDANFRQWSPTCAKFMMQHSCVLLYFKNYDPYPNTLCTQFRPQIANLANAGVNI